LRRSIVIGSQLSTERDIFLVQAVNFMLDKHAFLLPVVLQYGADAPDAKANGDHDYHHGQEIEVSISFHICSLLRISNCRTRWGSGPMVSISFSFAFCRM